MPKRIISHQARVERDIDGAVTILAEQHGDALIVAADPFLGVQYEKIVALAATV